MSRGSDISSAPPAGFEPAAPLPETGALSPELRGRGAARPYSPCRSRVGYCPSKPVRIGAGAADRLAAVTPDQLSAAIVDALAALVADGSVTLPDGRAGHGGRGAPAAARSTATTPPTSRCSWPRRPGVPPRELADAARRAGSRPPTASRRVEIAGPGFLNITRRGRRAGRGRRAASSRPGAAYGSQRRCSPGEKINLEFVSANPTGPLHLGGTRWAAVGDALGRIFTSSGAEVTREYYFNDHGAQIDRFARSLLASAQGRAGARGRLRRRSTSTRSPQRVLRRAAGRPATCPTTRRRRCSAPSAST